MCCFEFLALFTQKYVKNTLFWPKFLIFTTESKFTLKDKYMFEKTENFVHDGYEHGWQCIRSTKFCFCDIDEQKHKLATGGASIRHQRHSVRNSTKQILQDRLVEYLRLHRSPKCFNLHKR